MQSLTLRLRTIAPSSAQLRLGTLLLTAGLLAGCGTRGPASVAGGECKVFSPPPHVILGKTQTDQNWIDGEVEAGIGGCGYPRPAPRPEGLDAPATRQRPAIRTSELSPKKKGFIRRLKERVVPEQPQGLQPAAPVVVYPSSPPPPPSPAAPVEAPRPDPVLDFLRPRKTT